jgi:hypothetical protein
MDDENGFDIRTLTEDSIEEDLIDKSIKQSKKLKRGTASITVTVKNLRKEDRISNLWRDYFEFMLWKRYLGCGDQ